MFSKKPFALTLLILVTLAVGFLSLFNGAKTLDLNALWNGTGIDSQIFFRLRIPRTLTAFLAGGSLALCGMVFQALFRNPLATPYTLGVAGGASLGAVFYLHLGLAIQFYGISGLPLFAFAGAMISIASVLTVSGISGRFDSSIMLLCGVALSFFFSSLIMFIHYISSFSGSIRIVRWLMGGVDTVGMAPVYQMLPLTLPGLLIIFLFARRLNLMSLGEDAAAARGINPTHTNLTLFLATSMVVGAIVSVCGPIGFVGMIAPHICRLIFGPDHRRLAPASMLFGGMFLMGCDLIGRTLIAPAEIPVGVICALLGGPFFIWLLCQKFAGQRIMGGA